VKKRIVIKLSGRVFAMDNVKLLKDWAEFLVKSVKSVNQLLLLAVETLQDTTLTMQELRELTNQHSMN